MNYKTLIGLEIHIELLTQTKMFCSCKNEFGATPNTLVCEICMGYPGALPRINKEAVKCAILAGLAFDCEIRKSFQMDRKKYFYPDLTKGFQISQDKEPICYEGYIEIPKDEGMHKVRIERIHIEEDTGKSNYTEDGSMLLDYNRSGVPLIEIVTYPDISNEEEAKFFLEALKERIKHVGVSDVKMEEGSLRCDVNINVLTEDGSRKTAISEIKNLNSFKAVEKAIKYERERHTKMLEDGVESRKETRKWLDNSNKTEHMRFKEMDADYRLSVEGDIPRIEISDEFYSEVKAALPELPHEKKVRLMNQYKINEYDANIISLNKDLSEFFEETTKYQKDIKKICDWLLGDVSRLINENEASFTDLKFGPKTLSELIDLVASGQINQKTAKDILREIYNDGGSPEEIVKKKGLIQISDQSELEKVVDEVISNNPQSIIDYNNGKDRALGYLMGECMKRTKGKGNPQLFTKMLLERIKK